MRRGQRTGNAEGRRSARKRTSSDLHSFLWLLRIKRLSTQVPGAVPGAVQMGSHEQAGCCVDRFSVQ